jgi:hypothetical protein
MHDNAARFWSHLRSAENNRFYAHIPDILRALIVKRDRGNNSEAKNMAYLPVCYNADKIWRTLEA